MNLFTDTPTPKPIKRLLIANRGEIAVRVIRACRDIGITSVAVYSDADRDAMFVRHADEAYALGGNAPSETYLDMAKILRIAERAGADAVHPGYGFLSERSEFARAVIGAGLIWVGPGPETIEVLGNKIAARRIAAEVGAPLVAGTPGHVADGKEALAFAREHGLPIAIKAAFGGGGRGMKVAWDLEEVEPLFESAAREAVHAFGRGECFVEQFLDRPRHVEVQVLGDAYGQVKVIGTRDCSLQRRNQKLVEEAPAPFLSPEQLDALHGSARAICARAGYRGAGTVEYLLSSNGMLSFLEVNTRLQVEHPVTEETVGVDLVVAMIRIAEGARLASEDVLAGSGHALEFRINAEDPGRGFLPTPGPVETWRPPAGPGIRLDSGVEEGDVVPSHYDSLMAKLIVTGRTRFEALARARRALREFEIGGVRSVLPFDMAVLDAGDFRAEGGELKVHTRWIETDFADVLARTVPPASAVTPVPAEGFSRVAIELDGRRHMLGLPPGLIAMAASGAAIEETGEAAEISSDILTAPVTGTLTAWSVRDGEEVAEGQPVGVIEAMKMETQVLAHRSGIFRSSLAVGAAVNFGARMGLIE